MRMYLSTISTTQHTYEYILCICSLYSVENDPIAACRTKVYVV